MGKLISVVVVVALVVMAVPVTAYAASMQSKLDVLQDQINAIQAQINTIELTPGPQGATGPAGADGADGAPGADGADGAQGPPGMDAEVIGGALLAVVDVDDRVVGRVMTSFGDGLSVSIGRIDNDVTYPLRVFRDAIIGWATLRFASDERGSAARSGNGCRVGHRPSGARARRRDVRQISDVAAGLGERLIAVVPILGQ